MIKTWTRREVIAASVGLSAISPGISVPGLAAAATARPDQAEDGKRVTLLHFTDTHAQLETHPEYLPGATARNPNDGRLRPPQDRYRT